MHEIRKYVQQRLSSSRRLPIKGMFKRGVASLMSSSKAYVMVFLGDKDVYRSYAEMCNGTIQGKVSLLAGIQGTLNPRP